MKLSVHKFGGASIKDADSVRNARRLIDKISQPAVVIFSAMGKITNALESLVNYYRSDESKRLQHEFEAIEKFHYHILHKLDLEREEKAIIEEELEMSFSILKSEIDESSNESYASDYARIVSYGEYLSTRIMSGYLRLKGIPVIDVDARSYIITDASRRHATVNWVETKKRMLQLSSQIEKNPNSLYISQGFIGSGPEGIPTTLGREGSDYSASVFACCLGASKMIIWKDVEGVLTADPKLFEHATCIKELDYMEALALTYYGASVIHPKTVQPLMSRNIELQVRSFYEGQKHGTVISSSGPDKYPCCIILKKDIALLKIKTKDLGFVQEGDQEKIFKILHDLEYRVYLAQNNPLSFIVLIDEDPLRKGELLNFLNQSFELEYMSELELINVRHQEEPILSKVLKNRKIILEQRTSDVAQFVVESNN